MTVVLPTVEPTTQGPEPRWAFRLYVRMACAVWAVVALGPIFWPRGNAPTRPSVVLDWLLGRWLWWDAGWYVRIAQRGYSYHPHQQSSVAFFPVYPLSVRALGSILPGGVALAAILLTMISGATAVLLFHRWCATRLSPSASRTATVMLVVYPYAWFLYGAAYSDALYLALVLAAFILLESDKPLLAGVVGAAATAARPTGVTLLIGLLAITLQRRGAFQAGWTRQLRRRDLGVALAAIGLAGWCAYLALRFGNPLAFVETEGAHGWDQAPGLQTWLKQWFFWHIGHDSWTGWVRLVAQAVACAGFLAAVPAVWRRFGFGYGVYVLAAVLLPTLSTSDFMGAGRYLLCAFPVFALVGDAIDPRPMLRRFITGTSFVALAFGTSLFASGYLLT